LRKLYTLTILLFLPIAAWSSSPRINNAVPPRITGNYTPNSLFSSVYSDLYSDIPTLVRSLVMPRAVPIAGGSTRGSLRGNNSDNSYSTSSNQQNKDQPIETKTQYINFLKSSVVGNKKDCTDRYNKFVTFFNHDSTLSGEITPGKNSFSNTRLDITCDFLNYSYWCFALGFAYATRNFDDPYRINTGSKCLTYQEFCQSSKVPEDFRINEYLSRIIDEIIFYNTKIKNTNRNIVNTVIRNPDGSTTNGWKGYDTDTWVQERFPKEEMKKILCK
jgi:hypothetical protein